MSEHLGYDKPEKTEAEVGQQIHRITRKLVKRANRMASEPAPNETRILNRTDVGDKSILSSTPLDAPMKNIAIEEKGQDGSNSYHQATAEYGGAATYTISGDKITSHTGKFEYMKASELQDLPGMPLRETVHGSAETLATIRNGIAEAETQQRHSKAA